MFRGKSNEHFSSFDFSMDVFHLLESRCLSNQRPCCRLLRYDDAFRSSLPLARRGRPYTSSGSRQILCKTCLGIKHEQGKIILETDRQHLRNIPSENHSENIFEVINDINQISHDEIKPSLMSKDIPHEIEFSLINSHDQLDFNQSDYDSPQMLVWKMNTSSPSNTIDIAYDTGSLTVDEKKLLLQEAVNKLQMVLRNRPTSLPENDSDQIEFTYRALQTTVDILSSSFDPK